MSMRIRSAACRRFERLSSDALDRSLSSTESEFLSAHRTVCAACRRSEEQGAQALNMLRQSTVDAVPDDAFDRRVIRRVKTQTVREGFRYWSPVALGATLAMIGVLAAMQVALKSETLPERQGAMGEARRLDQGFPAVPELANTPNLAP